MTKKIKKEKYFWCYKNTFLTTEILIQKKDKSLFLQEKNNFSQKKNTLSSANDLLDMSGEF